MIWLFVLVLVALTLTVQHTAAQQAAKGIRTDHRPADNLVEPGEPVDLLLTVGNAGRLWLPFVRLRMKLPEDLTPVSGSEGQREISGGMSMSFTTWLRPGRQKTFRLPVTIARRGRYLLPPLLVATGDFLGLNEHETAYPRFREVVVPPREAPEEALSQVLGGFLGDLSVHRYLFEDPVLTTGFHEYTGREPMRSISWTRTARTGQMMVKQYDHTAERSITVLLDVSACDERTLETCCESVRTVCRILEEQGADYGFASNAALAGSMSGQATTVQGLGARHFSSVLETLGRVMGDTLLPLETLFEQAVRSVSAHGCVLVTADPHAGDLPTLRRWQQEGNTLLILSGEEAAR